MWNHLDKFRTGPRITPTVSAPDLAQSLALLEGGLLPSRHIVTTPVSCHLLICLPQTYAFNPAGNWPLTNTATMVEKRQPRLTRNTEVFLLSTGRKSREKWDLNTARGPKGTWILTGHRKIKYDRDVNKSERGCWQDALHMDNGMVHTGDQVPNTPTLWCFIPERSCAGIFEKRVSFYPTNPHVTNLHASPTMSWWHSCWGPNLHLWGRTLVTCLEQSA